MGVKRKPKHAAAFRQCCLLPRSILTTPVRAKASSPPLSATFSASPQHNNEARTPESVPAAAVRHFSLLPRSVLTTPERAIPSPPLLAVISLASPQRINEARTPASLLAAAFRQFPCFPATYQRRQNARKRPRRRFSPLSLLPSSMLRTQERPKASSPPLSATFSAPPQRTNDARTPESVLAAAVRQFSCFPKAY